MGGGDGDAAQSQWTQKLYALAASEEMRGSPRGPYDEGGAGSLQVNVDGPYGLSLPLERYRSVLLVGGGIGVTPLHSYLRELYRRSSSSSSREMGTNLKTVRLVWTMKTAAEISLIEDTVLEFIFIYYIIPYYNITSK